MLFACVHAVPREVVPRYLTFDKEDAY